MTEIQNKQTGTTTVGLLAKNAVIIAAEQKATMGYLVASKKARKVYQIDDHIGLTIAGSVGDAQAMIRILKAQFKLYKLERGPISIKAAATLLSNILHGNKYFPFYNQFLMGGFDKKAQLYSFDPIGGANNEDQYYSTGSGSPMAYGVLEDQFKEDLSADEAVALAIKAIKAAIGRDIASGGKGFTIAIVDKDGYKELSESELKKYM